MDEDIDTRLRAVEFLLVHLISRTRRPEDIKADQQELKDIAEGGHAWKLMPEITRAQARDVVETAANLLDDALFQANAN
ncbi:MAG: hypothetical protein JHD35_23300 [Sphingopyxis sp.]|nr:hypothetical protein [Sphingopyxis sp.]